MSNPSQTPSQYAQPERFQFTLETLVIIMVMSAMAFAILFALPDWMAAIGLVVAIFMVPTAFLARVIYSRGYARAFAIGALIPAGLVLYNLNDVSLASQQGLPLTKLIGFAVRLRSSLCGGWLAAVGLWRSSVVSHS